MTVVGLRHVQHKAGVHFRYRLTGRKELFDSPAQKAHPHRGRSLSGGQWSLAEAWPRAPLPAPPPILTRGVGSTRCSELWRFPLRHGAVCTRRGQLLQGPGADSIWVRHCYLRSYPDRSHPGVTALPTLDLKSTALRGPEIGASEDRPADLTFNLTKIYRTHRTTSQLPAYTFTSFLYHWMLTVFMKPPAQEMGGWDELFKRCE